MTCKTTRLSCPNFLIPASPLLHRPTTRSQVRDFTIFLNTRTFRPIVLLTTFSSRCRPTEMDPWTADLPQHRHRYLVSNPARNPSLPQPKRAPRHPHHRGFGIPDIRRQVEQARSPTQSGHRIFEPKARTKVPLFLHV